MHGLREHTVETITKACAQIEGGNPCVVGLVLVQNLVLFVQTSTV